MIHKHKLNKMGDCVICKKDVFMMNIKRLEKRAPYSAYVLAKITQLEQNKKFNPKTIGELHYAIHQGKRTYIPISHTGRAIKILKREKLL